MGETLGVVCDGQAVPLVTREAGRAWAVRPPRGAEECLVRSGSGSSSEVVSAFSPGEELIWIDSVPEAGRREEILKRVFEAGTPD
jgi:hypothetical protein